VVGASFSGRSHAFRRWLEETGGAHALLVPRTHAVHYNGPRRTAAKLVSELPRDVWADASTGMGVQGERRHRWACLPRSDDCPPGMRRWLLVQRDLDDADEFA
jgi:hypothetical protein